MQKENSSIFNLTVIVAALGYFVDIYDLLLFTIVREPSLRGIGVADGDMIAASTRILNWQMIGLLIGGIVWGVMGDRKGRLSVLFGSITMYSVANFATGFVQTVDQYAVARRIIEDNRVSIEAMTRALLEWETIDAEQIEDIVAGRPPRPPKDRGPQPGSGTPPPAPLAGVAPNAPAAPAAN